MKGRSSTVTLLIPHTMRPGNRKKGANRCQVGCRVGAWEVRVSGPHDEIRQGKLEGGHRLILGVVECKHGPFGGVQILQLPEQTALVLAGSLTGGEGRNDGVFGFPFVLVERGQPGC